MARLLSVVAVAVLAAALAAHALRPGPAFHSPWCRPGDPLAGVYHPSRLQLKARCSSASGRVERVVFEEFDGDVHITLRTGGGERLVVEIIPQDRAVVRIPDEGADVTVVGPRVYDTRHSWYEIHPAWWVSSGRTVPASPTELDAVRRLLAGGAYSGDD